ncbi:hypothetical protein Tco_0651757 [Tanacetum coccineum]|uniref:Uncharacterized protein n=1 Tax=Tanacetum coccineum TaxID=301880 RepID=A0ABQ4WVY4_9ASTR
MFLIKLLFFFDHLVRFFILLLNPILDTPTVTSEGADDSNNEQESSDESSKQENQSEEQESDSEQDEESDDDDQEEEEFDQENESEDDEMKSDEEQGMDGSLPTSLMMMQKSRNEVTLAKVSSQPQSTYEAASTLTEFELKKILLDKREKSKSYLTAPEHQDCYYGLKKSYALDKDFFILMIDAETNQLVPKRTKERFYGPDSSYGTKSQPKFTRKSVQSEELVFEVADSDMTQISDRESG